MALTKSGFLEHRACSKAHWLKINRPGEVAEKPPSEFAQMLMRQGYAVEELVRELVAGWPDAASCQFQEKFEAAGLEARADLVRQAHLNLASLNDGNKAKFSAFLTALDADLSK